MRVLIINTAERIGGAAIAAGRLMEALKDNGIKSKMLVLSKQTSSLTVVPLPKSIFTKFRFYWERFIIWIHNGFTKTNLFSVSIANTGVDITQLPEFKEAHLIHLHWINQGMLSLKTIQQIVKSGKPIVWTMHDMWPATGICHHARSCDRFKQSCGSCPFLNSKNEKDLSHQVFKRKKKLVESSRIIFVTCSHWLKEQVGASGILGGHKLFSVPNPIPIRHYKPHNRDQAALKINLPFDKKLVLFGALRATDERKGVRYLIESLHFLIDQHPELATQLEIVIVGKESSNLQQSMPFKTHCIDYITNEKAMITLYNSVDLFVTPSLEENLPNTIMEAMACGIPCVGFNVGGIPEMIDHLQNGYVATYKDVADFANGIYWSLFEADHHQLSQQAIKKVVTHYSEEHVAKQYIEVYKQLTSIR